MGISVGPTLAVDLLDSPGGLPQRVSQAAVLGLKVTCSWLVFQKHAPLGIVFCRRIVSKELIVISNNNSLVIIVTRETWSLEIHTMTFNIVFVRKPSGRDELSWVSGFARAMAEASAPKTAKYLRAKVRKGDEVIRWGGGWKKHPWKPGVSNEYEMNARHTAKNWYWNYIPSNFGNSLYWKWNCWWLSKWGGWVTLNRNSFWSSGAPKIPNHTRELWPMWSYQFPINTSQILNEIGYCESSLGQPGCLKDFPTETWHENTTNPQWFAQVSAICHFNKTGQLESPFFKLKLLPGNLFPTFHTHINKNGWFQKIADPCNHDVL